MENKTEKMLTPEEAAERLSVSAEMVFGWLRSGQLRGAMIGGTWRVPLSAVLELKAERNKQNP